MTIKLTSPVMLVLLLGLLLGGAAMGVAVTTATPAEPVRADLHPPPPSTPTTAPLLRLRSGQAPGWWTDMDFEATPALKKLPGAPRPQFQGGVGGEEPGKPLKIKPVSCPTAGVKITGVETGGGAWWNVIGVAAIPNIWYWKVEASTDGKNWLHLYRQESPGRGILSRVNLTTLPAQPAFFRLTAVDRTGNYPEPCTIRVNP